MLNDISLERLSQVHPELSRRIQKLSQVLDNEGIEIQVTQGIRSWTQQEALYDQGRTLPGRVVTDAEPGYSNHNYGFAVDVVPMKEGKADWKAEDPEWQRIVALAPSFGLRDGISWKDEPHLELIEVTPKPSDEMRQTFVADGVAAVWEEFNITSS